MLKTIINNISRQHVRLSSNLVQSSCSFNAPDSEITTLNNNFRVVSENWNTRTSTIGVWVNTGSRYETPKNNGVAHFLEHMAFKGTNKRSQHSLELEVENKGGNLDAYTSREMTVYLFRFLNQDIEWAVEMLSDILRNSNYEKSQIERERGVILREMEEIESTYQEVVFDNMHASSFRNTSLGQTILGPEENVRSIDRKDLRQFIDTHYRAPNMILTGVGGINHDEFVELGDKYFGDMSHQRNPITAKEEEFIKSTYCGSDVRINNDRLPLVYAAFASQGPGWTNVDTLPLMIACAANGTWDRNNGGMGQSNSNLAKQFFKNGHVHSFQNFFTCYHDTSLWGIYLTCDKSGLKQTTDTVIEELLRFCTEITDEEIERAKNSLKTQFLLVLDGTTPICEEIGRHMISYNRRIPPHEMLYRIENLSSKEVRDTCARYIRNKDISVSSIGPVEGLPDYDYIRRRLHW